MDENVKKTISQLETKMRESSPEEIFAYNKKQSVAVNLEYQEFHDAYQKGLCYICKKPFNEVNENNPCMHILLRRNLFKKDLYEKLFKEYEYFRIESYLRWVANEEVTGRNINDLKDECAENKIFNKTITWKNVEWTLDCSQSDFNGHEGGEFGKEPHWHFQMKTDGFIFIKFNDFHIKFKEYDLVTFALIKDNVIKHTFGNAGMGMQNVMDFAEEQPEAFLNNSMTANGCEDKATVRIQSIISASPGETFSGDDFCKAVEMSKKTGKTVAACMQEILGDKCSVSFVVCPHEGVPEVAQRGKRKK